MRSAYAPADMSSTLAPTGLEHSPTTHVCIKETVMSEEAQHARQALQESMDLREQGHTDE